MLMLRSLEDDAPPAARTRIQNNPTLLFSWWCTGMAVTIILFRIFGRMVRTNQLFREDKIMAYSMIPLLIRMGLVHAILLFGTNNVDTTGLSALEIHHRSIGSRLVLASRIFYAMFIWTAKFTVSEFLKRLISTMWKKSYETLLHCIRIFLVVTFFAVVIATLSECQPFDHYWQVVPDPGPKCRRGYAQLITMGAADIITDILIVIFPIPIIIKSAMPLKRKLSLVVLFALSLILIAITAYRVPAVISQRGRQQYRTVWASGEILAAAAVSNALVLGGFVRDRGLKKNKYKFGSASDSIDKGSARRNTLTLRHWGSDEDLVRDTGYRVKAGIDEIEPPLPRPAPVALPALSGSKSNLFNNGTWHFPLSATTQDSREADGLNAKDSNELERKPSDNPSVRVVPPRHDVSFFDLGGLLEDDNAYSVTASPVSTSSAHDFASPKPGSHTFLNDIGGLLSPSGRSRAQTHPAPRNPPAAWSHTDGDGQVSPRSAAFPEGVLPTDTHAARRPRQTRLQSLQDVGGLLSEDMPPRDSEETITSRTLPNGGRTSEPSVLSPLRPEGSNASTAVEAPSEDQDGVETPVQRVDTGPSLQDVGGLLVEERPAEESPPR